MHAQTLDIAHRDGRGFLVYDIDAEIAAGEIDNRRLADGRVHRRTGKVGINRYVAVWHQQAVGIGEFEPHQNRRRRTRHFVVVVVERALVGVDRAVRKLHARAVIDRIACGLRSAPGDILTVGQGEGNANGVDLHNASECALRGRNVVAHIRRRLADLSGNGRDNLRFLAVVFGNDQISLRLQHRRARRFGAGFGVVALELGDAARVGAFHALPITLRAPRLGLGRFQVCLALVDDRLIAFVVELVEQLPFFNQIALFEKNLLNVAVDLRLEFDFLHGLDMSYIRARQIVGLFRNRFDGDRLRPRRRLLRRTRILASRLCPPRVHVVGDPTADHTHDRDDCRSQNRADGAAAFHLVIHRSLPFFTISSSFIAAVPARRILSQIAA